MKTRNINLITLLFVSIITVKGQVVDSTSAEKNHEASIYLGSYYTPLLGKNLFGGTVDVEFYPIKRWATGVCYSMSQKKLTDTFGYNVVQPLVDFYEMGWVNQYDVIHRDKIRLGLNVNNGIAVSRLGDNSEKEIYYTRYGAQYRAKEIKTNYYYTLQPGIDLSVKLFGKKHFPDYYLTAKCKYRFVFGDTRYGQPNDFTNYYLGLGISIIGFTGNDHKSK